MFKFKSKLSTWIAQIAYNTCLNHLEKKKPVFPENEQRENEARQSTLEDLADQSADLNNNETLKYIFSSQRSELLKLAVNKLPAVYQTLITLFHYEELVYEEIAHYPVTLDVFQLSQNKDVQLEVALGLAGEKQSPSTESPVN